MLADGVHACEQERIVGQKDFLSAVTVCSDYLVHDNIKLKWPTSSAITQELTARVVAAGVRGAPGVGVALVPGCKQKNSVESALYL